MDRPDWNQTLNIGTHLSFSKGFQHLAKDALSIDANTFQFFLRNPRGAAAKDLNIPDVEALRTALAEHGFARIVAHAPYTLNACSVTPRVRELALEMFMDDLARMEHLPGNFYNFHPGSHTGQGVETGVAQIAEMLNAALTTQQRTTVLLETMCGKGSEVGRSFHELRAIIEQVDLNEKLGVCFDACHLFDAGYDIVNDLDGVLAEFDRIVGLAYLRAFHINDSMNPLGSAKDRHAKIGEGCIGFEPILRIVNHPALRSLPFILETPNTLERHGAEIKRLREASAARAAQVQIAV